MGWKLILLSVAGMLLVITFVTSAARSLWATAKVDREWTGHSQPLRIQGFDLPIYCVEGGVPFLAVTGLLRAKVFVGRPVVELLSPSELRAALEHEAAHVRSFDNVKQLLLKSMLLWNKSRGQVAMWLHSSEAAADEEALAGGASALELSAALVKIGRVTRQPISPSPVLASQFLPCHATSSLSTRIRRLEQRLENPLSPEKMKVSRRASRVGLAVSLAAILVYSGYIHMLLPQIHEMLEILVR